MELLYIILGMLCRFLCRWNLIPGVQKLAGVESAHPGAGRAEAYSIWLPILGRWTLWMTNQRPGFGQRNLSFRIERGLSLPRRSCGDSCNMRAGRH